MGLISFDPKTHTYTVDGEVYPSVTHICRYINYDKAANANPYLRDAAANRGTMVHECTAMIDNGIDFEEPPEITGYLNAYRAFLRDYKPQWLAIEKRIASGSLECAGTLDRFGIIDDYYAIVDIKSTATLSKDYVSAQLYGYKEILTSIECLTPLVLDKQRLIRLYGLQLKSSGAYRIYEAHKKGMDIFALCLFINKYREEINHAK